MGRTNLKKNKAGYGYKYTDIAQINEYLDKNGWSYYQYTERIDGEDYIFTVPMKDDKEYPPRRGCRIIQGALLSKSNAAQELGAAITYARRYSLLMAFGLATEDDDAECLTRNKPERAERKARKEVPEEELKAQPVQTITPVMATTLKKALVEAGASEEYALKATHNESYEEITIEQFKALMKKCETVKGAKNE